MAYVFCNQCGHRNPPESGFCSSCGSVLDRIADHTITLAKVDPLQEAPGADDDVVVSVGDLATGVASLIVQVRRTGRRRVRVARSTDTSRSSSRQRDQPRRHHGFASPCRGRANRQRLRGPRRGLAQWHLPQRRADRRRGRVASRRRVAGRQVSSGVLRAVRRLSMIMQERPYLSIGEVLGLLLEEFPDVTISKIRFLESQGLDRPRANCQWLSQVLRQRRRSPAGDPARAAREFPAAARSFAIAWKAVRSRIRRVRQHRRAASATVSSRGFGRQQRGSRSRCCRHRHVDTDATARHHRRRNRPAGSAAEMAAVVDPAAHPVAHRTGGASCRSHLTESPPRQFRGRASCVNSPD